jgi:hypothetical protein
VFFNSAKPARSLPHIAGEAMLNLVRPLPDIEIALEGGLWLENSNWMSGFPPQIVISGEIPAHAAVTIDGSAAEKQADGSYRAAEYDATGPHIVLCEGKTCSYSIVAPSVGWEAWQPLSFGSAGICGAQVTTKIPSGWQYTKVPTSNPILIGANPGEVFQCEARPSGAWSGYVPFKPVWALPQDPLHCKRETTRILLLSAAPPVPPARSHARNSHHSPATRWCKAILDCRRKRLAPDPSNGEAPQVWLLYTRLARDLARKLKQNDA